MVMVSKSPTSIALFGIFGAGNFGNEGSLVAMVSFTRAVCPDAQLSAICTFPERVMADYGIPAVPIRVPSNYPRTAGFLVRALHRLFVRFPREIMTWARTINHMRRFDLLVIPGTGILDDYAISPGDLPYGLFRWCLSARLVGAKILFVSIGAGPIVHPVSRLLMKCAARLAAYRSFRDQISKDFMASLGLDTRYDPVFPDLTFSLPAREDAPSASAPERVPVIGVGLMSYYGWRNDSQNGARVFDAYLRRTADFVIWLLNQGYSVRLVIGEDGDSKAVERLASLVRSEVDSGAAGRLTANQIRSLETLLEEISSTDILVGTRFHNMVYGILLGKPVISVGYASRNAALLADVGLGKYCQNIEQLELQTLVDHFVEVRDGWARLAELVDQARRQYRERLDEQFDNVLRAHFVNPP